MSIEVIGLIESLLSANTPTDVIFCDSKSYYQRHQYFLWSICQKVQKLEAMMDNSGDFVDQLSPKKIHFIYMAVPNNQDRGFEKPNTIQVIA